MEDETEHTEHEKTDEDKDPMVIVYELETMSDDTLRIGNSIEVPRSEAAMLIDQKKAKHPVLPIGEVPGEWT